jgi:hypothetical protein
MSVSGMPACGLGSSLASFITPVRQSGPNTPQNTAKNPNTSTRTHWIHALP